MTEQSKSKYTRESALEVLAELNVKPTQRLINLKSGTLGLRRLGALDYLVKFHGYWVSWS